MGGTGGANGKRNFHTLEAPHSIIKTNSPQNRANRATEDHEHGKEKGSSEVSPRWHLLWEGGDWGTVSK